MENFFRTIATQTSRMTGSPAMFVNAVALIALWLITGPYFNYSDTWQLVINTATTVITFLMVFLIQNTQNRDTKALHLKLDEIIRALKGAHNEMIDVERLSDNDLERLHDYYAQIHEKYAKALHKRRHTAT